MSPQLWPKRIVPAASGLRSLRPPGAAAGSIWRRRPGVGCAGLGRMLGVRMVRTGLAHGLLDRNAEREVCDRLLECVRRGHSSVLVVRGEPGIGKTALLGYAVESAAG